MNDPFQLLMAAIAVPAALAPLCLVAGKRLRSRSAWIALAGAAFSLWALAAAGLQSPSLSTPLLLSRPWVPSLDLAFSLRLDGLSLFFGLVVAGMGCLVLLYSRYYLDDHTEGHGRFYAFMLLFMAAMLGTVLADDLLLTFVFWEITGVTSYLLIGFNAGSSQESAYGARRALLVTLGTGLGFLAGVLLLRVDFGTTRLSLLLAGPAALLASPHAALILGLLLLAAFGKSAQVPFQFWLPGAMAAPTPVSAYLHSATLVKLGVFLAARLYPLFHTQALWSPLLLTVGGASLIVGAVYALLSHDLKAVLAYTTVAQLGALLLWYGLAPLAALPAAEALGLLHILSHVLYKGSLFMQAGILDHVTGTRDLRKLRGLRHRLPLTFAAALLACASLAGLPGSLGFVSKEIYVETLLALGENGQVWAWPLLALFAAAAVCLAAVAFRVALRPYLGELPKAWQQHLHHAKPGFQASPLLLACAVPLLGLFPGLVWRPLAAFYGTDPAAHAVAAVHLGPGLALSLLILGLGFILYRALYVKRAAPLQLPAALEWGQAFDRGLLGLVKLAKASSKLIRVDRPADYLTVVVGACTLLLGAALWALLPFWPDAPSVNPTLMEGLVLAMMAGAGLGVVFLEQWTTRLLSLGIVGFLVCFYFMLNKAPDLALTQMLIESATLLLLLLLLGRFPKDAEQDEKKDAGAAPRKALAALISVGVGLVVFVLMLNITAKPHPRLMGKDFLEQTLPLALGSNAVNTVLVDFRGFDTMFEITVLAIAALGCLGLLMRWKEKKD
jgi:NADH:ubiquinone oxidoreductase subunit 5 (subunit L)/multisubunit Na+/H+ antiporter MnhA subunit/multisubunit Na+/H+ antiporter MnhB subunit